MGEISGSCTEGSRSVFLVFEYCDHDFSKLMMRSPNDRTFTVAQIKCILHQVNEVINEALMS